MSKKSIWTLLFVVCAALVAFFLIRSLRKEAVAPTLPPPETLIGKDWFGPPDEKIEKILASYAGSESCRDCHPQAFETWKDSHHALAEREMDMALDRVAFDPPRIFKHGTQTSEAGFHGKGGLDLTTQGFDGKLKAYRVERVFGVHPLRQFLVSAGGGRLQATEAAWDPVLEEWFNVYGDEDRKHGEWGHWTGRGMNWNSMCASCHNTRLIKNYKEENDTYYTRRAEMGVGCEACHGPLTAHVAWQRNRPGKDNHISGEDPNIPEATEDTILETCGSCHSRRQNLTGDFAPGEKFLDHYALTIVNETDVYYADGQVRDEDFEYASFLGSRMRSEGVLCINCHDPHSGKTKFAGNALCLQCHQDKVDPAAHSHHQPDTPGGRCVDCHMPRTPYMQRHPRRDHGFTIPDPLLTREHGIPNACNRCHDDKTVDWAIEAMDRWYGDRMERHTRVRARAIARARAQGFEENNSEALQQILKLSRKEKIPYWRAVMANLLRLWIGEDEVQERLVELTRDADALVRGMAARALEPIVAFTDNESIHRSLQHLQEDPLRMVRVEAAWALPERGPGLGGRQRSLERASP